MLRASMLPVRRAVARYWWVATTRDAIPMYRTRFARTWGLMHRYALTRLRTATVEKSSSGLMMRRGYMEASARAAARNPATADLWKRQAIPSTLREDPTSARPQEQGGHG